MAEYGAWVISVYDMPHAHENERHAMEGQKTVTEAARDINVVREADVIVVGGGRGHCRPGHRKGR